MVFVKYFVLFMNIFILEKYRGIINSMAMYCTLCRFCVCMYFSCMGRESNTWRSFGVAPGEVAHARL